MRRRQLLRTTVTALGGIALGSEAAAAADTQLEPGTWYDATVLDVTDGDTIDVELDSDGTEYEIRVLGLDTPETKRNNRYEEVREWEGIEDDNYLADWGENAKDYARAEFPAGRSVQIAVDDNEDEEDQFGRLLAYVRYDKNGDGSMDTLYNLDAVELGYARVYGSSLTRHDEIWQAERNAREAGRRVWSQSDPENTSEVDNNPVDEVFVPNASSVRTDTGAIDPSRVPAFAESTATQSLGSEGIDYSEIPLVGLDEAANTALIGGLSVNEDLEDDAQGQHQVFLTNLVDYLSSRSGRVLVAGGNREFNASQALSNEDAVVYQRFLEGVGIDFEQVNSFDGAYDNSLDSARGIIATNPPQAYSTGELDALSSFVADGGAVILMASAEATDTMRSNLDDVAAGLGSDLRINDDQVFDDSSNAGDSSLLLTSNFDSSFPLFDAYSDGTSSSDGAPTVDSLSASEVETDDSDAEFDADWAVSDTDGDLESVELVLTDDTDGETEDSATVSVSGDSAGGTTRLVAAGDDGSGNDYTVDLTVADAAGNETTDSAAVTEGENADSAPAIDTFDVTDDSNPNWDRYDVGWAVSDADGDLAEVTTELVDGSGTVLDSDSDAVGGSSASGSHSVRSRNTASEVVLTATDGAGASTSESKSV